MSELYTTLGHVARCFGTIWTSREGQLGQVRKALAVTASDKRGHGECHHSVVGPGSLLVAGWSLSWRWLAPGPGSYGPVPWPPPSDTLPVVDPQLAGKVMEPPLKLQTIVRLDVADREGVRLDRMPQGDQGADLLQHREQQATL